MGNSKEDKMKIYYRNIYMENGEKMDWKIIKKNLLDIVWSTLSIDCLFPPIWIFNVVSPAFSRW